jgi:hypothetical protein
MIWPRLLHEFGFPPLVIKIESSILTAEGLSGRESEVRG